MRIAVSIFISSFVVLATACGGADSPTAANPGPGGSGNPTTPSNTNAVSVSDNLFTPSSIQVTPGTTVRWTWTAEARDHNVRFPDGTGSADLAANATFSKTFPTAGTFTYQCTLHPGMNGTVTVR